MSDPRERSRELLRRELADRIFDVFAEHGFEQTTAEEAARAAGISRATFFRYFGTKEEVVVAALQRSGAGVADLVRELPVGPEETAWDLLRRAHEPVAEHADAHRARLSARVHMISKHASLRTHLAGSKAEREELLSAALATRMERPAEATAITAAMLALVDLTWGAWTAGGDEAFGAVLDGAMRAVRQGGALRA